MSNPWLNPEYYNVNRGITLDITHRCLLQCTKCMRSMFPGLNKRGKDISLKALEVLLESNVREIDFCGQFGDSIYHPKFIDILEMCNKYDKKFNIHTNGHGKKDSFWDSVIEVMDKDTNSKFQWIFGLDGLPHQSHIYRVGQDGDAVWEVMKRMAKHSNRICWQYIVFKYNEDNLEQAKQLAEENNIRFWQFISARWDDGYDPLRPSEKFALKNARELHYG